MCENELYRKFHIVGIENEKVENTNKLLIFFLDPLKI